MILTKFKLSKIAESLWFSLTEAQTAAVLEYFKIESGDRYEWTEQDIAEQLQHYLRTGEFKKA